MGKWFWVIILSVQVHFAASFLVPLWERDQVGILRWVWPWGVGDSGFLGEMTLSHLPLAGLFIALTSASLFILAVLGVLGIWIPQGWSRDLAIAGAVLQLILMIGFFGPTKLLPITLNLAVLYILWRNCEILKLR